MFFCSYNRLLLKACSLYQSLLFWQIPLIYILMDQNRGDCSSYDISSGRVIPSFDSMQGFGKSVYLLGLYIRLHLNSRTYVFLQ